MTDWVGKRYWLVGASDGLGAALAQKLSRLGVHVILSARRKDALERVASALPGPSTVVPMDVSNDASVADAAKAAGAVDGMIYLAGLYWPQSAQDWDADQIAQMADVNYVGALRVLGHVLPQMIERDAGHIVVTGSLSGFRGLPGSQGYAASKAAVMVLAEALYADLRATNVRVQLANPGFIRTRLTEKNTFRMPFLMEPDAAAQAMIDQIISGRFQKSFPAPFAWVFRLAQFLPDEIYYRVFR